MKPFAHARLGGNLSALVHTLPSGAFLYLVDADASHEDGDLRAPAVNATRATLLLFEAGAEEWGEARPMAGADLAGMIAQAISLTRDLELNGSGRSSSNPPQPTSPSGGGQT